MSRLHLTDIGSPALIGHLILILRFSSVPDTVDVHIVNRPGQPFLGTGEAGQGPTAAALANAIAAATGQRSRDLPLSPARIKASMK